METKVNFAVVGAFVLLLGAALIGGILWLSSDKSYGTAFDTYVVYMKESVAGLSPDGWVGYRGVQVGRVRRIELSRENVEEVKLTLDIERGTPIKQDTVAVLRTQGLTGIAYVELTGGTRDSPPLRAKPGEPYPVIPTGPPSLLVRMDAALTTLINSLTRSSDNLNAMLDKDNRAAIKQTLANLATVSRTLAARSKTIDAGVADAARTMENSARAMENAARLSREISELVERARDGVEAFDRMSNEGARTMPEVRQMVSDLHELTTSLRRFSDQLERNPSVLVRGKPAAQAGPGE
jgi:phospholipid/cholesterol/gamma-HCH transport system substrate-binding protein